MQNEESMVIPQKSNIEGMVPTPHPLRHLYFLTQPSSPYDMYHVLCILRASKGKGSGSKMRIAWHRTSPLPVSFAFTETNQLDRQNEFPGDHHQQVRARGDLGT